MKTIVDVYTASERGDYKNNCVQFEIDAAEALGVTGNPKWGKLCGIAYDMGHAYGTTEIFNIGVIGILCSYLCHHLTSTQSMQ